MSSKLREESRYPYHTSLAPPQTQQNTMQRACMMLLIMPLLTAHGKVGARGDGGEGATFDNTTSTEWMTLATARYQVKINQHTGAIISLSAPSPPNSDPTMSSSGPTWAMATGDGSGPRITSSDVGYVFSYAWSAAAATLSLRWGPPPSNQHQSAAAAAAAAASPLGDGRNCSAVPESRKVDCGYSGSSKVDCLAKNCCWLPIYPDPNHYPVCFNVTAPPPPPPPPVALPAVAVDLVAANQRFCDAVLRLVAPPTNVGSRGGGAHYTFLEWPASLQFDVSTLNAVWYPMLPGLELHREWFANPLNSKVGQMILYPGSGTFAELVHFNVSSSSSSSSSSSTVSISTVSGPDFTVPHYLGFVPPPSNSLHEGTANLWYYKHRAMTNISVGCNPTTSCNVGNQGSIRTRFAFGGTATEDVALYAVSNGMVAPSTAALEQANVTVPAPAAPSAQNAAVQAPELVPIVGDGPLPLLSTRLPLPQLQQLGRSLFYKLDAKEAGMNFSEYASKLYSKFPVPGMVHFVGFEHIGFDNWYPDYLPPNPTFGTGCDLQDAFAAAQAAGHFAMPYTNPTWWDMRAPTLANLPAGLTLRDVTCLNASYETMFEVYSPLNPAGAVTELEHPYIYNRWVRLMNQFAGTGTEHATALQPPVSAPPSPPSTLPPSTRLDVTEHAAPNMAPAPAAPGRGLAAGACNESSVQMHSDFIFEDQLGARHAYQDYNPLQHGRGAFGYEQALINHARNFSSRGLGTEQGFDKIARWELGFYGHALEMELGSGARPYPFGRSAAGWVLHPLSQVLFGASLTYQVHNLDNSAFADQLNHTCWVLASGGRLSVSGASASYWESQGLAPWYRSVGVMQRVAVSRWTGYAQLSFERNYLQKTSTTVMVSPPTKIFPGTSEQYTIESSWAAAEAEVDTGKDGARAVANGVQYSGEQQQQQTDAMASGYKLPAGGCAAFGSSNDLVAGWFTSYNNRALPPDQTPGAAAYHAIVEDRACHYLAPASGRDVDAKAMHGGAVPSVCVYHPMGIDTALDVQPHTACTASATVVTAVGQNGQRRDLPSAPAAAGNGLVTFTTVHMLDSGNAVDHFVLHC